MTSTTLLPICFQCRHIGWVEPSIGWTCKAFPKGIPTEILASRHNHRRPFPGDHGIQFEPKIKGAQDFDLDWQDTTHKANDPTWAEPDDWKYGTAGMDEYKKFDKSAAHYKPHASDPRHQCEKCHFFNSPNGCALVKGEISPEGWCIHWKAKEALGADNMSMAMDPPVSERQRRAMWAAASGHSNIGIPESVGREFADADKGGKLPKTAKDMTRSSWRRLREGLAELARFFGEEEQEPEHQPRGQDSTWTPENNMRHPGFDTEGHRQTQPGNKLGLGTTQSEWRNSFDVARAEAHGPDRGASGPSNPTNAEARPKAAHVAFTTRDGRVLFVKRAPGESNFPGYWSLPGGKAEINEGYGDAAKRECNEELGMDCTYDRMKVLDQRRTPQGWDHVTYAVPVEDTFDPILNNEHDDYMWAPVTEVPKPLHPGVAATIGEIIEKNMSEGNGGGPGQTHDSFIDQRGHYEGIAGENERTVYGNRQENGWGSPDSRESYLDQHLYPRGGADHGSYLDEWGNRRGSEGRGESDVDPAEGRRTSAEATELSELVANRQRMGAFDLENPHGRLSASTREDVDSQTHREDMPESAFLGPHRTYPVKEKRDGKWQYTKNLLLAAARRARMQHEPEIARRADNIRSREFGSEGEDIAADMAMDWARTARLEDPINGRMSLAFDFQSVRAKDDDGRMRVSTANISKANVCEYYGREIPDFERLGLDPNKKYKLLRHPEELQKAASTFNNLPILSTHVPVTSTEFPQDKIIGATGSDTKFDGLYLKNNLAFWPQEAIDDIESNAKKQLSAGYRYKADMTPGEFKGVPYDGVMRDIVGNHLALVREGRAGADVVVGDSNVFSETRSNYMSKLSPQAARAVVDALKRRGMLAMDTSPEEAAHLVGEIQGLEHAEGRRGDRHVDDARDRHVADMRRQASDARKRADDARRRAADMRRAGDARRAMDAEADADEADLEADRFEDAEDMDPNSGMPLYVDMENPEHPEAAVVEETEDMRREDEAADRRASDARIKMGRDETAEERRKREEDESAADARARLGRDETPEEKKEREARDRRARDFRAARDARRRAMDAMRRAASDMRDCVADMRRAEDGRRRAASDMRGCRSADDARRAEDGRRRAADEYKTARDKRRRAMDAIKHAADTILTTGMDMKRAADARRMGKDNTGEAERMTRAEVEDTLRSQDTRHRQAMDEAIRSERDRSAKADQARRAVRPIVGELALDSAASADEVYRSSLKILGVDIQGVDPSAFPTMFQLAAKARAASQPTRSPLFAHDSANNNNNAPKFEDMFPHAASIGRV